MCKPVKVKVDSALYDLILRSEWTWNPARPNPVKLDTRRVMLIIDRVGEIIC